jgi:ABC-type spermidine/putrescine transport system permease subunit II
MKGRGEYLADCLTGLVTLLVLAVLYAPVIISALFSVVDIHNGKIDWASFSLSRYVTLWDNPSILQALANTAIVALIAVVIAMALAVLLALYAQWEGAIGRKLLELVIYLPFLLPPIVTGLSLLVASSEIGLARGLMTVVIGHTVFVLAVAYRLVLTRLEAMPASLVEASSDLGASRLQTFRHVLLPHLASAIVTGAVLALTLSFDETLITVFLAGEVTTLPLRLWAMMRVGFSPEINALVTLVLVISLALAGVVAWRMRPEGQTEE